MANIDWIWHSPKLEQLAKANLKRYFAVLYKLIVEENKKFDVLMAGGNSGLIMALYAQMFYDTIKIDSPIVFKTTPQRHFPYGEEIPENLVDNTVLYLDIKNQIRDYRVRDVSSILFVDDEIGDGITARACINAFIKALSTDKQINLYITAENQEYEPKNFPSNVEVKFIPFANEIEGMNNVVMYLIPNEIYNQIKNIDASDKSKVALLLGLPRRTKTALLDGYDFSLNHEAYEKIPDFEKLMVEFEYLINKLIQEAIQEYKERKIDLESNEYVKQYLIPD